MKKKSIFFSGTAFQNGQGLVDYALLLVLLTIGLILVLKS